jgi:predicted hotdog family 3-hydroxylacyl-ACP dehydratase
MESQRPGQVAGAADAGHPPVRRVGPGAAPPPAIEELVPHRRPMLLLDAVSSGDEARIECRVSLRDDSPFVEGGRVRSTLAIEYMAQCVAAWAGLQGHAAGEPVRIGYLIGAREITLAVDYFFVGDDLRIEATKVWGDLVLGHFACAVHRGDETLATGTLNVYRGDAPAEQS